MTKAELLAELKKIDIDGRGDEEEDHHMADNLLLEYIDDKEVDYEFYRIGKWYA